MPLKKAKRRTASLVVDQRCSFCHSLESLTISLFLSNSFQTGKALSAVTKSSKMARNATAVTMMKSARKSAVILVSLANKIRLSILLLKDVNDGQVSWLSQSRTLFEDTANHE